MQADPQDLSRPLKAPGALPLALRRTIAIVAPLAVIAAGIGGMSALNATKEKPEVKAEAPRAPAVFVETARLETTQLTANVQGEIRARTQAQIAAEVGGAIIWVSPDFAAGGIVKRGQPIARIDDRDYQLGIIRAEAEIARAQQVLVREDALARVARLDFERAGQKPPTALALREPQLAEARAMVAAAEAGLEEAKLRLSRTTVRAPFDGRVTERNVDLGQYVGVGSTIGRAYASDVVEARLPLSDGALAQVGLSVGYIAPTGQGPEIRLFQAQNGELREWRGRIVRVDAQIDPQTRTVMAIGEVANPLGKGQAAPLAPGMFVNAEIMGRAAGDFVAFPRSALRGDGTVLVVGEGNLIAVRQPQLAGGRGEVLYAASGLADGERVVVSALPGGYQGQQVEIVSTNQKSGEALVVGPTGGAPT